MDKLTAQWYRMPKPLRFAIYYGTGIVWVPVFVAFCMVALLLLSPMAWLLNAYERFDK